MLTVNTPPAGGLVLLNRKLPSPVAGLITETYVVGAASAGVIGKIITEPKRSTATTRIGKSFILKSPFSF
jgi:hypothetical protein